MQAKNNNTPSPKNGQLHITGPAAIVAEAILAELEAGGHSVIELVPAGPLFTPKAALTLAAQACEYLLTGQPEPQTFDPIDLELAIPLLQQMAATIEEVRR